jgi:hypothetical protein
MIWRPREGDEKMSVLAVLAAAAREAEELLASNEELTPAAEREADRRMKAFMKAARQAAR